MFYLQNKKTVSKVLWLRQLSLPYLASVRVLVHPGICVTSRVTSGHFGQSAEWWAVNRCNKLPEWQLIPLICTNRQWHQRLRLTRNLALLEFCYTWPHASGSLLHGGNLFCSNVFHRKSLCSLSCASHQDDGALGQGAVPQLYDRPNHCVADVAAGENLPGLKPSGLQTKRWARGSWDGGIMGGAPA